MTGVTANNISPGLSDAVDDSADGALPLLRAIKLIVGVDFGTLSSPDSFVCSFRHHFRTLCRTEMAFPL